MGYRDIHPEEIYQLESKVLVDIRSPHEFMEFHIPGAINLPLFEDEEKRLIGYVYRNRGLEEAKSLGEEIARGKLKEFYGKLKELKDRYGNVIVYCWRGGMRSQGLCEAMSDMGLELLRLRGGYRAYREFILRDMERLLGGMTFLVLTGKTGVGKTKILRELRRRGYPVLDLEDLAKDRGSVFGSVGVRSKVSQKMFDSLIYEELRRWGRGFIFVEDESRRIGDLHIPDKLWEKKCRGIYIEIKTSLERRIENILEEYTSNEGWEEQARESLRRLRKYLGPQRFEYLTERFEEKDYREVVRFLIEEYYDKNYKQFGEPVLYVEGDDPIACAEKLEEIYVRMSTSTNFISDEGKVQDILVEEREKAQEVGL